jgi:hypothetical protein
VVQQGGQQRLRPGAVCDGGAVQARAGKVNRQETLCDSAKLRLPSHRNHSLACPRGALLSSTHTGHSGYSSSAAKGSGAAAAGSQAESASGERRATRPATHGRSVGHAPRYHA